MYDNICMKLHEELQKLDEKYASGAELSKADLEDVDTIYHALKSMKTYEAMEGNSEAYDSRGESMNSYRRGRDSVGRYTSRGREVEPGRSWNSYRDNGMMPPYDRRY